MHYDIKRLKEYPITDYLATLGLQPVAENDREAKYFSPLREENNPSFSVLLKENTWKDFGTDLWKSDVIDLVQQVEKLSRYEAFSRVHFLINNNEVNKIFERIPKEEKPLKKSAIINARPLDNHILIDYCKSRGIDETIARTYLYQVNYLNPNDQKFFAIGMYNTKGGCEIRGFKNFKTCIGEKTYTQLTQRPFSKRVMIFEGMFDFLSLIQLKKIGQFSDLGANVIVLHSISCLGHTNLKNYVSIDLFLDNDDAGKKATEKVFDQYPDKTVCDFSQALYPNHKDLNDYLLCQKRTK